MAIDLFKPQYRAIQNPIDLDTLTKTYTTLEQGHQQAVASTAAYATKLAELDLNEAEDAWRQGEINKVRQALKDNMVYGNAAAALDDVIKTYGDVASNAGMIGRLRAQQDYKTYLANLEANETLDEDTKDYYREKNKYYYQDKVDTAGNIIGGTKWNPLEREVNHIPMSVIFELARKWAAEEGGYGESVMFLDANGKPTQNYADSVTGELHYKSGTEWKKLDDDKVRAAIDAAIKSTPGAQASIAQEYKIAEWKYKNGRGSDILDKNGRIMSPDEYLENKINPFVQAVTYHNKSTKVEYGDAWKAQLIYKNQNNNGTDTVFTMRPFDGPGTFRSNPIMIENTSPVEAQAEVTANRQELSNILTKYNPDLKLDLTITSDKDIYKAIVDNVTDSNDLAVALSAYHDMVDNQNYINTLTEGKDKDDVVAFETYNAVISMSDLPNNDTATKGYNDIRNEIYGGYEGIRNYMTEDEQIAFKNAIGEDNLKKYGIIVGKVGNNYYTELNRNNDKSLYAYAKAIEASQKNIIGEMFDVVSGIFTNSRKTGIYRYDKDGNETRYDDDISFRPEAIGTLKPIVQFSNPMGRITSYVNSLQRKYDNVLGVGKKVPISNIAISHSTPRLAELYRMIQADPDNASKYQTQYNNAQQEFNNALQGIDMTQANGYLLTDENVFKPMSSEERKEYTKQLRSVTDYNKVGSAIVRDPLTGGVAIQLTIPGKIKTYMNGKTEYTSEPITFIAGSGSFSDPILKQWENDSNWKAGGKVQKYYDTKRPISITNDESFTGIDKVKFIPVEGGFDVLNTGNNNIVNGVDKEKATRLLDQLSQWEQTYRYVKAGGSYNEEGLMDAVEDTSIALCELNNEPLDYANYYQSILIRNLTE